jgi:hypothetical protein
LLRPDYCDSENRLTNNEDGNPQLPTASDRLLLDETFTRRPWASDWDRDHDWYHHITGYKHAADTLFVHFVTAGRDARKLGPPIMFLYRHHIELALKQLTRECGLLLGRERCLPLSHNLADLWRVCLSLLSDLSVDYVDAPEIKHTTRLMNEFCRIDATSQTFRYPEDKNGCPSLLCDIELQTIREVVEKISLLLECISTDLSVSASR